MLSQLASPTVRRVLKDFLFLETSLKSPDIVDVSIILDTFVAGVISL